MSFSETGLVVHLRGARREDVLAAFPEPAFIDQLAVTPEEGLWGFVLDGREAEDRSMFAGLLQALWRIRERNAPSPPLRVPRSPTSRSSSRAREASCASSPLAWRPRS